MLEKGHLGTNLPFEFLLNAPCELCCLGLLASGEFHPDLDQPDGISPPVMERCAERAANNPAADLRTAAIQL
jgi:hypothetical protein